MPKTILDMCQTVRLRRKLRKHLKRGMVELTTTENQWLVAHYEDIRVFLGTQCGMWGWKARVFKEEPLDDGGKRYYYVI